MKFARIFFILPFLLLFFIPGYSETDVQKGARIVKMNDDNPSFGSMKSKVCLRIYDRNGEIKFLKRVILASYTENIGTPEEVQSFIGYITEPADEMGSGLLYRTFRNRPGEKYFYMKSIRKIKKVVGGDKKLSFFGSDFSNSDAGKPEYMDWNYRFLGDGQVEFKGKMLDCYIVEKKPKTQQIKSDEGYGKKIGYFEKSSYVELKEDIYNENMKLFKEKTVTSLIVKKNIKGEKVFYTCGLQMKNLLTGTKSQMIFLNYLFEEDANVRKDIFTTEYLTRRWW